MHKTQALVVRIPYCRCLKEPSTNKPLQQPLLDPAKNHQQTLTKIGAIAKPESDIPQPQALKP